MDRYAGPLVAEIRHQLIQLFATVVPHPAAAIPLQCQRYAGTGAGGASDTEVDSSAVKAAEHIKRLGDFERAVVRQHDAATADAKLRRGGGDRANQCLRA